MPSGKRKWQYKNGPFIDHLIVIFHSYVKLPEGRKGDKFREILRTSPRLSRQSQDFATRVHRRLRRCSLARRDVVFSKVHQVARLERRRCISCVLTYMSMYFLSCLLA